MSYNQYQLLHNCSALTCWLKNEPKLKVGSHVTLKQTGDILWKVMAKYGPNLDSPPDVRWKVGGLK